MRRADGPGRPFPLGVTLEAGGRQRRGVLGPCRRGSSSACSTRPAAGRRRVWRCRNVTDGVFHGFVPGLRGGPGLRPARARPLGAGARALVRPAKLLLDPYAKAVTGAFAGTGPTGRPGGTVRVDRAIPRPGAQGRGRGRPSASRCPAAARPGSETVLYEAHVSGLTKLHPACPSACAGPISASPSRPCSTIWSSSASPPSS